MKKIISITTETVSLNMPFIEFARHFADRPGTAVLLSGGDSDSARFHILASSPWLTIKKRGENPFNLLKELIYSNEVKDSTTSLPITAGLFGYLSYDLKDCIEELPKTSINDLNLPDIYLFAPSFILIHDKIRDKTELCLIETEGKNINAVKKQIMEKISKKECRKPGNFTINKDSFCSNFNKDEYVEVIKSIKEYIKDGHVYQVNMAQRFETDFEGDSYSLFCELYAENPAPFFAYLNCGDHQIVSTSPERFIQFNRGKIEARPIKGTIPRGKTPEEDKKNRELLQSSKKDEAELSMIVDLLRNDIGKVSQAGSVKVISHKQVEQYTNVFHLVSVIEGKLDTDMDCIDLLKASFPGGSITGCPKIRSMEIIDEKEPVRRHIYTGSIGYISFHGTMDLSIAIRTAEVHNGKLFYSAGGGIVFDSDPESEFNETIYKGQTLMKILKKHSAPPLLPDYLWINGKIIKKKNARISAISPGYQYGYGLFESIRYHKGKILFFNEHIARFKKGWEFLFDTKPPDLSWELIIHQIIEKNRLADKTVKIKILTSVNEKSDNDILITADEYIHRLEISGKTGMDTAVYPEPRQSPLADYKTLNYLYYYLAGKWAKNKGKEEALITNPDGTLSETNSGNLLIIRDKKVICPVSSAVLPGIMEKKICNILEKMGYLIYKQPVHVSELTECGVIITNSMIGAVQALTIDDKKMKDLTDLCICINKKL